MQGANSFAWVYARLFDADGCSLNTEIDEYWRGLYDTAYDPSILPDGAFATGGSLSQGSIEPVPGWYFTGPPIMATVEFSIPDTEQDFGGSFEFTAASVGSTIGSMDFSGDPVPSGTKCMKVEIPLLWPLMEIPEYYVGEFRITDWSYNIVHVHRITFNEAYPPI